METTSDKKPVVRDLTTVYEPGSYPARTTEEAIDHFVSIVGPHLFGIPHGEVNLPEETGTPPMDRTNWIVGPKQLLEDNGAVQIVQEGSYTSYRTISTFRIPRGKKLDPSDIYLGCYDAALHALPILRHALEGRPKKPMQVGIADPMAIPVFGFGGLKTFTQQKRHLRPFEIATQREIERLTTDPDLQHRGLVIQLEYPVPSIAALTAARWHLGKQAVAFMSGKITKQASMLPPEQDSILHFCYGRYMGQPKKAPDPKNPKEFLPMIDLINQTLDKWPDGHKLPKIIGLPIIAEGGYLPSRRHWKEIATILADIALPPETVLSPGIVGPWVQVEEIIKLAGIIQDKTGRTIALSTPCGKSSYRCLPSRQTTPRQIAQDTLRKEATAANRLNSTHVM